MSSRAWRSLRACKWAQASHSISCRRKPQPPLSEMPPEQRPIPRFIAEPPHDSLPYGRWSDQLRGLFLEACEAIESDEEIGEPGDIAWFPERTFNGRTYIPATAPTSEGFEVFGFVAFEHGPGGEPASFSARADYTDETAGANPDWKLDLSDEEIEG